MTVSVVGSMTARRLRVAQFHAGLLVEDDQFVGAGGGGVDTVPVRDDQDPVDLRKVWDDSHDPLGVYVDFDELACAKVCDEQQAAGCVEAGVVEAGSIAW